MLYELVLGGITHHYVSPRLNYCNVVNRSTGTIVNSYGAVLAGNKDFKVGPIIGQDSVCAPIMGIVSSTKVLPKISDNLQLMLGAYNVNTKQFLDRNIEPVKFLGVTPVVGLVYRKHLYFKEDKNIDVSLDTLFSIGIVSHAISVRF